MERKKIDTPGFKLYGDGDSGYLKLNRRKVVTTEAVSDNILVDRDRKGRIVGVEVVYGLARTAGLEPPAVRSTTYTSRSEP